MISSSRKKMKLDVASPLLNCKSGEVMKNSAQFRIRKSKENMAAKWNNLKIVVYLRL